MMLDALNHSQHFDLLIFLRIYQTLFHHIALGCEAPPDVRDPKHPIDLHKIRIRSEEIFK